MNSFLFSEQSYNCIISWKEQNSSYALGLRNMLSNPSNLLELDDVAEGESHRIELEQKIFTISDLFSIKFDEAETLLGSFDFDEVATIKFYFEKKMKISKL